MPRDTLWAMIQIDSNANTDPPTWKLILDNFHIAKLYQTRLLH